MHPVRPIPNPNDNPNPNPDPDPDPDPNPNQPWAQPGADLAERLLAMPGSASAAVSIEEMARMIEEHNWGQL